MVALAAGYSLAASALVAAGTNTVGFVITAVTRSHKITDLMVSRMSWQASAVGLHSLTATTATLEEPAPTQSPVVGQQHQSQGYNYKGTTAPCRAPLHLWRAPG